MLVELRHRPLGAAMTATSPPRAPVTRRRDLLGAALAWAFVVLLLASEAALTLRDVNDSDAAVASFYAQHRAPIVVLQLVGLVAAGLLAAYSWRLRRTDAVAGTAGLITAALACA